MSKLFGLVVESREAKSTAGHTLTKNGERFWVTVEPEGWVDATSVRVDWVKEKVPYDLKTFPTREAAERFAKKWKGHPWWCNPNGNYEVVEVTQRYKTTPDGYSLAKDGDNVAPT